jgi:hypothetical protein
MIFFVASPAEARERLMARVTRVMADFFMRCIAGISAELIDVNDARHTNLNGTTSFC